MQDRSTRSAADLAEQILTAVRSGDVVRAQQLFAAGIEQHGEALETALAAAFRDDGDRDEFVFAMLPELRGRRN